ncbi:LysR family transcriptional regulator [Rhodococcus sp. IEGM 1408]|uniref:LysR family transcriptional regulator n=1 Tax=Rhodococcus sp. IEGM 1408 TaxID=3082220 RepID=UPI0029538F50|nr:LysR family transcriptional regulator [Rhodococcus sp. IEGM 1408]MDV8002573.1 LysR family transcriptional regulator [Rhodococcus sp. IEGM 1408]
MEFRQVEYFLAVVENDGINGAATALGVAQPTVSQSLRSLERELGVHLFHRIGRGMVLTAAGRSLIGPSRQILRDVSAVGELLAASPGEVTGRLDLMVFPALATGPIVDLVAGFRRSYPKTTVRFAELRNEESSETVIRDGHCEFVVAHLPLEDRGHGLEVIELGEQEYWLVYPPGTDLPPGPLPFSAMPDIPMVFVPRGGGSLSLEFDHAMRRAGVRPPLAALVDHREARLPMVLAGLGGSFVERSLAESVRDVAVVRPCDPTFSRPFGLAFDPTSLSTAGQAFVDLVRAANPAGP